MFPPLLARPGEVKLVWMLILHESPNESGINVQNINIKISKGKKGMDVN
jgi:hypothetical protein